MLTILNRKGNMAIFPESAWNFSPNVFLERINWGVIKIAEKTGANIVPVAVDIVGDDYCVIIGDVFDYSKYPDLQEATENLRDTMATLAWELIEMKQPVQRHELNDSDWLKYIQEQISRMPWKDQSKEESYMYRPKGEICLGYLLQGFPR
jgi:hypothetical protein